jgi:hypothetical protein
VEIKGVWYVNVYAPSGAERKLEREQFFNNERPLMLPVTPEEIPIAGDFNCIINKMDIRGNVSCSKELESLIRGIIQSVLKTLLMFVCTIHKDQLWLAEKGCPVFQIPAQ